MFLIIPGHPDRDLCAKDQHNRSLSIPPRSEKADSAPKMLFSTVFTSRRGGHPPHRFKVYNDPAFSHSAVLPNGILANTRLEAFYTKLISANKNKMRPKGRVDLVGCWQSKRRRDVLSAPFISPWESWQCICSLQPGPLSSYLSCRSQISCAHSNLLGLLRSYYSLVCNHKARYGIIWLT